MFDCDGGPQGLGFNGTTGRKGGTTNEGAVGGDPGDDGSDFDAFGRIIGFFGVNGALFSIIFPPENFRIRSLMLIGGSSRSCSSAIVSVLFMIDD